MFGGAAAYVMRVKGAVLCSGHNTAPSTRITYATASPNIQIFKLLIL